MQNLSDRELSFRIAAYQDKGAFLELHARYFSKLQKFLYFKISTKEDAEDIANQVFLKVWEYLISKSTNKEMHHIRAFIYKIARNEIAGFYRAQGRMPKMMELDKMNEYGDYPDIPDQHEDIVQKQMQRESEDNLIECVQKLPEPYREIVALRFFEGLNIKEIADVIEKSQGNVRVLIHRGRKMLKSIMGGKNYD